MSRPHNRAPDALRPVSLVRHFTKHAEGSVLVAFGDTQVLCTASVEERVPPFLRDQNRGWVTAEYGMLPRATNTRTAREAARGRQSGRTLEIQRLIGRSLRAAVNLEFLGPRTITVDCDVIQADGGTRTAAITGGFVALADAVEDLARRKQLPNDPIESYIASVSVGVVRDQAVLDLEYSEDKRAQTDMNVVMNGAGGFVEIQGTAEDAAFTDEQLGTMLGYAKQGIRQLITEQQAVLGAD